MGSRREEERNEKIIRGLMKLPPNRRCINCNSLGPQYACTNFWTFVCITCSGIHREFTHRVKSVSMSKFTSQEVESLQKGGNQRAREIYLKDWDAQRLRLPDSSNVDKVRTFIKNVYVDRKYAGGKTSDKPPRDMQSLRNHEDQTRRASSYHSYSQSPPYDYQYEDRRYGKQAAVLTRKPGSDRGLYEGKISSFLYSPGRFSDQMCEDRFANESSVSRVSDYSVSSGGDTFRSEAQSPNLQDTGISSPSNRRPGYISTELIQCQTLNTSSETKSGREADGIPPPQRTASLGSIGSVDSNSVPPKSVNYDNSVDAVADVKQFSGVNQDTKSSFPTLPPSSVPWNPAGLDLLEAPFAPGPVSSASSANLIQPSETLSVQSVDFFQSPQISSAASLRLYSPPQNSSEISVPKDEGWATFDLPQSSASCLGNEIPTTGRTPSSDGNSLGNAHLGLSSNASMLQPSFQSSNAQGLSSTASNPWHSDLHKVQDFTGASINSWNAFEDSTSYRSVGNNQQISYSQPVSGPSLAANPLGFKVAEDPIKDVSQRDVVHGVPPDSRGGSFVARSSYTQPDNPSMDGTQIHASEHKSTNPFDLPYDSEESSDLFLDMSSIQSALPASQLPPSFLGGVSEPWFPQNPVTTYIPAAPQGGLGYIGGQTPASQLPSVPAQGSVASIGGNPFA